MNILLQTVHLAANGGFLHLRITKDRQIEEGPFIPVCIETAISLSETHPQPGEWMFNLGGVLAVIDLALDTEAILAELQPFARELRDELQNTISKTEALAIPEAIEYGTLKISRHNTDTILINDTASNVTLALHVLTLLTFTHGLAKSTDQLDEQAWSDAPCIWKTNTFTDAELDVPEALDGDFVLTDSAEFRLQKNSHLVTILPAGEFETSQRQIIIRIEQLLHLSYIMFQPMYQFKLLGAMKDYLAELNQRFGWT